jgi:hypothetical protein
MRAMGGEGTGQAMEAFGGVVMLVASVFLCT